MSFWVDMIIHPWNLKEIKMKMALKLQFQSNVFDDVRHKVCICLIYCDVEFLTVMDENHE